MRTFEATKLLRIKAEIVQRPSFVMAWLRDETVTCEARDATPMDVSSPLLLRTRKIFSMTICRTKFNHAIRRSETRIYFKSVYIAGYVHAPAIE